MAMTASDTKKEEILKTTLAPNETYKATVFGTFYKYTLGYVVALFIGVIIITILGGSSILVGALAGASVSFVIKSTYIGITNTHLNIAYLNFINVDKLQSSEIIRLDAMENVKVKSGLNTYKLKFKYQGKKYDITIPKKIITKKMKTQTENVNVLIQELQMYTMK